MRRLLRSPLLHFLALGTALFFAQGFSTPSDEEDGLDREIELEASVVAELEKRFAETMGRGP